MPRILVADDDPDICVMLELKLGSVGHDVAVAHDGAEALARAASSAFDLLLLDCMMPHHTGPEVAQAVRCDPRHRKVVIVLMSAQTDGGIVEKARRIGADAFIAKPFSLAGLSTEIDVLLSGTCEST